MGCVGFVLIVKQLMGDTRAGVVVMRILGTLGHSPGSRLERIAPFFAGRIVGIHNYLDPLFVFPRNLL